MIVLFSGKYTESKNGNLFLTSQATINKDVNIFISYFLYQDVNKTV